MANREQKNVEHDEGNPVNWGKEELDSWLQLHWPQLGNFSLALVASGLHVDLCIRV